MSENTNLSEKINWGNVHFKTLLLRKKSFYPSLWGTFLEKKRAPQGTFTLKGGMPDSKDSSLKPCIEQELQILSPTKEIFQKF